MALLKLAALGALGYAGYKYLEKQKAADRLSYAGAGADAEHSGVADQYSVPGSTADSSSAIPLRPATTASSGMPADY